MNASVWTSKLMLFVLCFLSSLSGPQERNWYNVPLHHDPLSHVANPLGN